MVFGESVMYTAPKSTMVTVPEVLPSITEVEKPIETRPFGIPLETVAVPSVMMVLERYCKLVKEPLIRVEVPSVKPGDITIGAVSSGGIVTLGKASLYRIRVAPLEFRCSTVNYEGGDRQTLRKMRNDVMRDIIHTKPVSPKSPKLYPLLGGAPTLARMPPATSSRDRAPSCPMPTNGTSVPIEIAFSPNTMSAAMQRRILYENHEAR